MELENVAEQLEFEFMKDFDKPDEPERIFQYARTFNISMVVGAVTGAIIEIAQHYGAVDHLSSMIENYFI